jgi:hypothetical protein
VGNDGRERETGILLASRQKAKFVKFLSHF